MLAALDFHPAAVVDLYGMSHDVKQRGGEWI
jgi:hypothetical protein